ncbi:hypothetical protein [Spartinivicinus marinus]|uniref:hypothetical protein n=1 Tax=Spartinivicinus marinus TaxID=2994442 RepID=UPI00224D33EE|nr:hypothetical protein [Spartinivicinus marinus]MCX4026989.1 hypothetical protein [Spartinivicinus marinus]
MSIIQQLAMKAKQKADKKSEVNRVGYSLANQVPDMKQGFSIQTNYGSIQVDSGEASEVAAVIEVILQHRLARLKAEK